MIDLTPAEYRAACRQDLHTFATRCFMHLHGRAAFRPNWHLEVIAAALQECLAGKIKRLVINLPPRHLKSLLASIALAAFWLRPPPQRRNHHGHLWASVVGKVRARLP
jgi:hypothetical protein